MTSYAGGIFKVPVRALTPLLMNTAFGPTILPSELSLGLWWPLSFAPLLRASLQRARVVAASSTRRSRQAGDILISSRSTIRMAQLDILETCSRNALLALAM